MSHSNNFHSYGSSHVASSDACALVESFLAQASGPSPLARSAARHFLRWARDQQIDLEDLSGDSVDRFARHRCRCGRYSPVELCNPTYVAHARRFVRHLECTGVIAVPDGVGPLDDHVATFGVTLAGLGYSPSVRAGRLSQAKHFAEWLFQSRIPKSVINDATVERFVTHDCRCGIRTKRGRLVDGTGTAHRRRGALGFVRYLREQQVIHAAALPGTTGCDPRLESFIDWLRRERGATGETIRRYRQEVARWLHAFGPDSANYDAATIRSIVLGQGPERSRASVRMTVTVLRSFLRFMVGHGMCAPSLIHAVPPATRRKLSIVPRAIPVETIERIIASCGTGTTVEVRDRAIILLLARMGLRAGDVWQLRLTDVDWRTGRLRLHGKSRRTVMLPLPQDAGDALLTYIEQARPIAATDRVFLRAQAPFTPLRAASEIAGIVARVLDRGGFSGLPTGSHVFRHSLASAWLRQGCDLDHIGIALRHASRDTTAIYAKIDVAMLQDVAQPWPGASS